MRYRISRASDGFTRCKPCEEAVAVTHREESKSPFVTEPIIYTEYFVDINNFEELQNFINKYGRLVIDKDEIIIYDDWIE